MEECIVARNAICIIKRALSRAKSVQQTALPQTSPPLNPQETGIEHSTSNGTNLPQPVSFNDIISECEVDSNSYGDFGDGLTWLETNPNPFDDYQQALFWTTWGQEVDLLGT
jgi:hypothetical protein